MDGVFLGLAGLLLGISLELRPWEIPRCSPASPWKTPPLLLGLTQSMLLGKVGFVTEVAGLFPTYDALIGL